MSPGDLVPHPCETYPRRHVRVIRVNGCQVTARDTNLARTFLVWSVDASGRPFGAVVTAPYASSVGCSETDGLEGA